MVYFRVSDTFSGEGQLSDMICSDGKRIRLKNAWFSREKQGDQGKYWMNIFDLNKTLKDRDLSWYGRVLSFKVGGNFYIAEFLQAEISLGKRYFSILVTRNPMLCSILFQSYRRNCWICAGSNIFRWTESMILLNNPSSLS